MATRKSHNKGLKVDKNPTYPNRQMNTPVKTLKKATNPNKKMNAPAKVSPRRK